LLYDMGAAELKGYASAQHDPSDFDAFWSETISDARTHPLDLRLEEVASPLETIRVYDLGFRGYGGELIRAWLRLPAAAPDHGAAVVQFHGYARGRGEPTENLLWASAGFVHVEVDTRGQGWGTTRGSTPDLAARSGSTPGFVTLGIRERDTYYYRRLFTDAVRAVEAARSLANVDAARLGLYGLSQGGATALASAALAPSVQALVARVPFLSDISRAVRITDAAPYSELAGYFAHYRHEAARIESDVLPYFDGVNFARRASPAALFVAALMDRVCPPSTVYAAFNAYRGPKQLVAREFNGHEAGGVDDELLAIEHFRTHLLG